MNDRINGFFGFLGLSDGEQKLMRGESPYDPYSDDAEARKMIVDLRSRLAIHGLGMSCEERGPRGKKQLFVVGVRWLDEDEP